MTAETYADVQELLWALQTQLKVPKNLYNKFGDYYYRNAEGILEAVKKMLPGGATIVCSDDLVYHGGDRYYINATACLFYKGQKIIATALAREALEKKKFDDSQLTGTASSYARKNALNGLFALDDVKDADSEKPPEKDTSNTVAKKITPLDKTGNPAVDRGILEAIGQLKNTVDEESLKSVYKYQYKLYKDSGATEEQLSLLEAEKDKHKEYLGNKNG